MHNIYVQLHTSVHAPVFSNNCIWKIIQPFPRGIAKLPSTPVLRAVFSCYRFQAMSRLTPVMSGLGHVAAAACISGAFLASSTMLIATGYAVFAPLGLSNWAVCRSPCYQSYDMYGSCFPQPSEGGYEPRCIDYLGIDSDCIPCDRNETSCHHHVPSYFYIVADFVSRN